MTHALGDHQRQQAITAELALVDVAADFLHEADNATPKLSVADLRERFDQLQSVGLWEKVGASIE